MTRSTFSRLLVCLSAVALASCQEYDGGYSESQIKEAVYARNFVKTFGNIDPNQDWNLVAQLANSANGVTRAQPSKTTPAGTFNISVLPEAQAAPLTTAQMKEYSKMLPESNTGGALYNETNLGRVTQNFSVTTKTVVLYPVYWWTSATCEIGLYYYSDETGCVSVTDNAGNSHNIVKVPITSSHPEELEYSYETAANWETFYDWNYESKMPSGYQQILVDANIGFKFAEASDWSMYGKHELTEGTFVKVESTSLTYDTPAGAAGTVFDGCRTPLPSEVVEAIANLYPASYKFISNNNYQICTNPGGTQWASVITGLGVYGNNIKVDPFIEAADANAQVGYTGIYPTGFRSKGIAVTLPASMKIGFYVTNGSNTMYSEGYLNPKATWSGHETEDQCYVATYESGETDAEGNPVRYLAFEDWYNSGDYDLNDIVFRVYGFDQVNDEEEKTEEGLLVCEDLGDFDFDFNDVVLKLKWRDYTKKRYNKDANGVVTSVEILGKEQTFSITGMAAGGALESTVKYKGAEVGGIHALLSGQAPDILNAGSTFAGEGETKTYTLNDSDWDKSKYPTGYVSQVFGEGLVTIHVENGTDAEKIITSTNYRVHGAPQMMLLPVSFEWPQELQTIGTVGGQTGVYPDFDKWVEDASFNVWINNHDDRVTKR